MSGKPLSTNIQRIGKRQDEEVAKCLRVEIPETAYEYLAASMYALTF